MNLKTKKKEVLAVLGNNLELKKFKVKDEEVAKLTELDVLKESLKKYVKDIHTEIMPLEMSLYEVYGEIMALSSFIDLSIELSEPEKMTKEQVDTMTEAIVERITVIPVNKHNMKLDILLKTGNSGKIPYSSGFSRNFCRSGITFKKMIESYENNNSQNNAQ